MQVGRSVIKGLAGLWFTVHYSHCRKYQRSILHTYHSRFIPEGVAEAFQIFLRDTHFFQIYLAMRNNVLLIL
jgi:hypothetical protein